MKAEVRRECRDALPNLRAREVAFDREDAAAVVLQAGVVQPMVQGDQRVDRTAADPPFGLQQPQQMGADEASGAGHEQLHPQSSKMATARVQPAEAPRILCGKQQTVKPSPGRASRLCSFSRWQ